MAQPTNSLDRYGLGSTFEDLAKTVSMISPVQVPFTSNIRTEASENILKEWSVDALASATDDAQIDGDAFDADSLTAPTRAGNYHQITRKDMIITGRAEVVNKPGMRSEVARQLAKAAMELRRNIETTITSRKIAVQGTSTTAGHTAGAPAWIITNDQLGSGGTSPTHTNGIPVTLGTSGTNRALTELRFQTAIQNAWEEGGQPDFAFLVPQLKRSMSNYLFGTSARIASQDQNYSSSPKQGATVLASVDFYFSPFGKVMLVPDRFTDDEEVLVIDSNLWAVSYLRNMRTISIQPNGDNYRYMVLADFALRCDNEEGNAVVADIDSTAAVA